MSCFDALAQLKVNMDGARSTCQKRLDDAKKQLHDTRRVAEKKRKECDFLNAFLTIDPTYRGALSAAELLKSNKIIEEAGGVEFVTQMRDKVGVVEECLEKRGSRHRRERKSRYG